MPSRPSLTAGAPDASTSPKRSLAPMIAVLVATLAPLVAATLMYYNPQWWPDSTSNYGQLIEPQRSIPPAAALSLTTLDGQPFDFSSLQSQWLLIAADGAECPESCARKLFITRNTHASLGKNVDRVTRVWFITDDAPVPDKVLEAYRGTVMLRAKPEQLAAFLLDARQDSGAARAALAVPMWIVDPLGHLMMQYPAQADPIRVRDDVRKLIAASRIG